MRLVTTGGLSLEPDTLRRHLALVGGPLDIMHTMAHFMRQLQQQQLPMILLGGPQDAAFLELPDLLDLNPVRTHALTILPGSSPDRVRENLLNAAQSFRTLPGTGGAQVLFIGRYLGGYWPFVMGRLPALAQQGTVVISDVRNELSTPLPQLFTHFLVWPEGTERMTRAVERWQRHQTATPYTRRQEPQGDTALWSATPAPVPSSRRKGQS